MDPIPALVVTTGAALIDAVDARLLAAPPVVAAVEAAPLANIGRPANCCATNQSGLTLILIATFQLEI